jgi:hypothetical protein
MYIFIYIKNCCSYRGIYLKMSRARDRSCQQLLLRRFQFVCFALCKFMAMFGLVRNVPSDHGTQETWVHILRLVGTREEADQKTDHDGGYDSD